jgi:hypothetical protein
MHLAEVLGTVDQPNLLYSFSFHRLSFLVATSKGSSTNFKHTVVMYFFSSRLLKKKLDELQARC